MADAARRQFHCAIVTWLLRRGLPPSVLEHPELQRAVRLLDPRASLPTPWDLVRQVRAGRHAPTLLAFRPKRRAAQVPRLCVSVVALIRQRVAADRTAVYTMTVSGASAPWTGARSSCALWPLFLSPTSLCRRDVPQHRRGVRPLLLHGDVRGAFGAPRNRTHVARAAALRSSPDARRCSQAPRAGEDAALRATLLDCVDPIALRPPQLLAVTSSDDHTQRYATDQLGGAPGFQRVASMACWGGPRRPLCPALRATCV